MRKPPRSKKPPSRRSGTQGALWLYGRHPVEAALANPNRRILRLVATREAVRSLPRPPARGDGPPVETVARAEIERLLAPGAVHQGVAAQVAPPGEPVLDDIPPGSDLVVVLDRLSDPRNVGAVLRSAAAFGAAAAIVQDRHSPPITGALAKAASGALEWVPLIRVANLARALQWLKARGYWIAGLDADAAMPIARLPESGPLALVVGAEGSGLRRLTRQACDMLAAIPATSAAGRAGCSLNAASAAAIALYQARCRLCGRGRGPPEAAS